MAKLERSWHKTESRIDSHYTSSNELGVSEKLGLDLNLQPAKLCSLGAVGGY